MSVYPLGVEVHRSAVLSDDGRYRYALERRWDQHLVPPTVELVTFVMLNPSTADAEVDDRTIGRCVGFARTLGAYALGVVNLYAYRATDPAELWTVPDPAGPLNDRAIRAYAQAAADAGTPIIAAWGANARPDRVDAVVDLIANTGAKLSALGTTKDGAPRHPLYLRASATLSPWPAS